ncbi:DUF4372 domain-containing protein [Gelidibacter sp.]|uniref:DUF4372 domain-containing protein n=1 Tax=Gelidibacter sp. TaxID=2018083 RepID=UPI0032650A3D
MIKLVLYFLDSKYIQWTSKKRNCDLYTKQFTTYDHLVTLIFAVIFGCSSLREVIGMLAFEGKINHLGLKDFPKRSTLSDANKRRSSAVFADIYGGLYKTITCFYRTAGKESPP